jgi:hypothetical protein
MRPRALLAPAALIAAAALTTLAVRSGADNAAGDPPTDLAVCDILTLVEELYESERFSKPRNEFEESLWPPDLKAKRLEVEQLEARMESLEEDSDEYNRIYERWDILTDEVWALESEIASQLQLMAARDRHRAFSMVVATAGEVAEDAGHRFVAMGGTPKPPPDDADTDALFASYQFRAFLVVPVFPAEADITDDVRFELGLK